MLSSTPTIGKGFACGQEISLDAPVKKKTGSASAEFAKVSQSSEEFCYFLNEQIVDHCGMYIFKDYKI